MCTVTFVENIWKSELNSVKGRELLYFIYLPLLLMFGMYKDYLSGS